MKIAVICKDHEDFLNHHKNSDNEYWEFSTFAMVCGGYDFDSIEITNKGSELNDFDRILRNIRCRMGNKQVIIDFNQRNPAWVYEYFNEVTSFTKEQAEKLKLYYPIPTFTIGCDWGIAGEYKSVEKLKASSDALDAGIEFMKSLNDLKTKKNMKITEETKIKDLIPKGFELNSNDISGLSFVQGREYFTVPIKKKEVKDFNWYCNKYTNGIKFYSKDKDGNYVLSSEFPICDIPFEVKIGLLKFICDDLDIEFKMFVSKSEVEFLMTKQMIDRVPESNCFNKGELSELYNICPKEFINSIFK